MKKITPIQAQEIIDKMYNCILRDNLVELWAISIVERKTILVENKHISLIRHLNKNCKDLADKIFGKEFPKDGTPCLVRLNGSLWWRLAYSNGNGEFYHRGAKKGNSITLDEWQVLDINNLPVNE